MNSDRNKAEIHGRWRPMTEQAVFLSHLALKTGAFNDSGALQGMLGDLNFCVRDTRCGKRSYGQQTLSLIHI